MKRIALKILALVLASHNSGKFGMVWASYSPIFFSSYY